MSPWAQIQLRLAGCPLQVRAVILSSDFITNCRAWGVFLESHEAQSGELWRSRRSWWPLDKRGGKPGGTDGRRTGSLLRTRGASLAVPCRSECTVTKGPYVCYVISWVHGLAGRWLLSLYCALYGWKNHTHIRHSPLARAVIIQPAPQTIKLRLRQEQPSPGTHRKQQN